MTHSSAMNNLQPASTPRLTDSISAKPMLLVVDDQAANIQIMHAILKSDYEICMATSGKQALHFCQSRRPDLILLDVEMPEMSGYEVCHWLKETESTRDIPVIFVTSHNDPAEEAQGLNEGAVDFITKPVHANVVKARIHTHLLLKQQREQLLSLKHRMAIATQAVGLSIWDIEIYNSRSMPDDQVLQLYCSQYDIQESSVEIFNTHVHPDDEPRVLQQHSDAIRDNVPIDIEFRIFNHNREERIYRSVAVILGVAGSDARRMTGVNWDITELRNTERLKREFVANVSHELRTPLTSIRGALGLLAAGAVGALPAAFSRPIDIALRNSERLATLIDDLLDLEKLEIGNMPFDLVRQRITPIVEQSMDSNFGYASKHGVQFKLVASSCEAEVCIDAHRCLQVLANLLSNAAKFSPPGGSIDISIEAINDKVRVSVRDYGPGIPEEFKSRIFGKFSQADSSDSKAKSGTGLGLAISKAIVERMGGNIGFETEANVGTTFYFDLPMAG